MFSWFSEELFEDTSYNNNDNETSFNEINDMVKMNNDKEIRRKINKLQQENFRLSESIKNLFDQIKIIDNEIKKSNIIIKDKVKDLDIRIKDLEDKMSNCVLVD